MNFLLTKQVDNGKVELYREIFVSLDVIDAEIFRCLNKLDYAVKDINDAGNGPYSPTFVKRPLIVTAVRQQTTLGSIFYHWVGDMSGKLDAAKKYVSALGNAEIVAIPDDWLAPLGGFALSKVRPEVTKFVLTVPPRGNYTQEKYVELCRKSLRLSYSLIARLAQEGHWITKDVESAATVRVKGGRPRNADDDWAWAEVREKGRTPEDVYPEWLKRIGERAIPLADPHDSFKKAISPQRKKREKRE